MCFKAAKFAHSDLLLVRNPPVALVYPVYCWTNAEAFTDESGLIETTRIASLRRGGVLILR